MEASSNIIDNVLEIKVILRTAIDYSKVAVYRTTANKPDEISTGLRKLVGESYIENDYVVYILRYEDNHRKFDISKISENLLNYFRNV